MFPPPPNRDRAASHGRAKTHASSTGDASGIEMLRRYEWTWLRHDVVAGLVLTTMLVPVGVAYAEASGVPGIYGLYATIIPLLAYALFGPSRILVLGRLLARRHPRRHPAAFGRRSAARRRPGQHDGHRFGLYDLL